LTGGNFCFDWKFFFDFLTGDLTVVFGKNGGKFLFDWKNFSAKI